MELGINVNLISVHAIESLLLSHTPLIATRLQANQVGLRSVPLAGLNIPLGAIW